MSDIWEGLISLEMCEDGLLHALDTESGIEKVQIGLVVNTDFKIMVFACKLRNKGRVTITLPLL